jgi:hypothetical protein
MARREIGAAVVAVLTAGLVACHDGDQIMSVHATADYDQAALDFGEVPVGEWREREIEVRNVGHVPFTLVEALKLNDNPSFHVDFAQELLESGQKRKVKVRFHPLREGELTTLVKVETDALWRPEDPIPVRGVGTPTPIQFDPPLLEFETLEIESDRTLDFTIINPVDLPLSVAVRGELQGEFTTDTINIPPRARVRVNARFAPEALGDRESLVQVRACEDCTPAEVRLRGRAVAHAFEFVPAPVPFDEIPVHERTQSFTRMTNITWRPVTLSQFKTSDEAFIPLQNMSGRAVGPGEMVPVPLEFAARFAGPNVGMLDVNYESNKPRVAQVMLDARGGRAQLAVTPIDIDFGKVPMGGKSARTVRLTNAGTNGPIVFTGVRGGPGAEHFGVTAPRGDGVEHAWSGGAWPELTAPDLQIAPGSDYLEVQVTFNPVGVGAFESTVTFITDDPNVAEHRVVTVRGTAYDPGLCAWRVLPWPALEFGNVAPSGEGILGFRFENAGSDTCAVKDIHLSNTGGGAFFMPGGALTGGVVPFESAFSAMIGFAPTTPGTYEGELSITVNDPATPVIRLPLRGTSLQGCLVAAPATLDFGPIRYDCAPEPRRVMISNACQHPVDVDDVWVGDGTSGQYSLTEVPPLPATLAPGAGFEAEVTYARDVLGQHYSPLFVSTPAEPTPLLVPLWAETNHEGTAVDRFTQGNANQVDVLFVVNNTTTMGPYQQRLQNAIPGFVSAAEAEGLSIQVGVTTSGLVERSVCGGAALGGEHGRLVPVDGVRPRIYAAASANVSGIQQNLGVGACHNLAQGLETMRMALSSPLVDRTDDPRTAQPNDGNLGFLRSSARLAVVFLADEDDHSGFGAGSYVSFLRGLKGPNQSHRTQAFAILPDGSCQTAGPAAPRLARVAQETGGAVHSVCASSYAGLLSSLLSRVSGPQRDFQLTFPAASEADIEVYVDGTLTSAWTWDPARNAVVFDAGSTPAPGETIEVRYVSECGTVTQ